jgi:hypothetical protein
VRPTQQNRDILGAECRKIFFIAEKHNLNVSSIAVIDRSWTLVRPALCNALSSTAVPSIVDQANWYAQRVLCVAFDRTSSPQSR